MTRKKYLAVEPIVHFTLRLLLAVALLSAAGARAMADGDWIVLIGPDGPTGIQSVPQGSEGGDAELPKKGRSLKRLPGKGVVVGPGNLVSEAEFGDCQVHVEFMMGRRSNSGVKLQQRYEIQLFDSHGRENPTARDCGGIYPNWRPRRGGLEYIDEGVPPKVNAAKPAGQWQTLDIVFRAPRFDPQGKKIENARFESVVLNGQTIHEDVELESPTGMTPPPMGEAPEGSLYLQGDHGPVAFRNVKVRPLAK